MENNPNPTTVRGWLETITLPDNAPDWLTASSVNAMRNSLAEAIFHVYCNIPTITAKRYYFGLHCAIASKELPKGSFKAHKSGYDAGLKILENQRQIPAIVPENHCLCCLGTGIVAGEECPDCLTAYKKSINPVYTNSDTHSVSFENGRAVIKERIVPETPYRVTEIWEVREDGRYLVENGYIPVAPQDYARMYERDLKWDEMRKQIQGLQDALDFLLKKL